MFYTTIWSIDLPRRPRRAPLRRLRCDPLPRLRCECPIETDHYPALGLHCEQGPYGEFPSGDVPVTDATEESMQPRPEKLTRRHGSNGS